MLKMDKYLIPLKSAFTQSAKGGDAKKENEEINGEKKKSGGQEVPEEKKSEKTLENQKSLDKG